MIENGSLEEGVESFVDNSLSENCSADFQGMVARFGFKAVLCAIVGQNMHNKASVARKLLDVDFLRYKRRPKGKRKTIAAYFRNITNGGAQKIVTILCNRWAEVKDENGDYLYNIILVINQRGNDGDNMPEYHVTPRVKREYIPAFDQERGSYADRFDAWSRICKQYDIDVVVSSEWDYPATLWDMLCIKGQPNKPAFILHEHVFCCLPYFVTTDQSVEMIYQYQLCDGIVNLTACDYQYTSSFSCNARQIYNPTTIDPDKTKNSSYESNTIVWVGRISPDKHPLDIIYMMKYVVEKIPDAIIFMVGDGLEWLRDKMENLINKLGLQNNIVMTGFTLDVQKYYKKAIVYVAASEIEGLPNTYGEAMAHAVPVVAYELPYLTYVQDGRGVITVPQHRYDLLAAEVVKLLRNVELAKRLGMAGKKQITEIAHTDIVVQWRELFDALDEPGGEVNRKSRVKSDEAIILRYTAEYSQRALNAVRSEMSNKFGIEIGRLHEEIVKRDAEIGRLHEEIVKRDAEIKAIDGVVRSITHSFSFKIGRSVTFIPRKMRGAARCYKQNGINGVIRLTKQRLKEMWHR